MIALSYIWEYPGVCIKYDFDLLNWQEDELPDSAEGPDTLLGTYGTWALASKLHEKLCTLQHLVRKERTLIWLRGSVQTT